MTINRKPAVPRSARPGGSKAPAAPKAPKKKFSVGQNSGTSGRKMMFYGASGIGKSSISVLAPKPVMIPLDNGSGNLIDPKTGNKIIEVEGVRSFEDTRDVLHQYELFDDFDSVIIDNVTKMEDLSHQYMFDTIKHEKGSTCSSIEGYGFGKGYRHLYDIMKLILQDCDELVRRGKNVILIAQCIARQIPNAAGDDYLCNCPRLYPGSKNLASVADLYCEWCDDLLFMDYANTMVHKKKITGDTMRAIFTQAEPHFKAKTRALPNGTVIDPVVSFEDPTDDSIFQYVFGGV